MQYVDIKFPARIALGAQRRTGWSTKITQSIGGKETAIPNWTKARHSYDLSFAVRTATDYDDVVQHFHSVRGRAFAFPFKDILDYRVEASRGVLVDDGGSPTLGFHLGKTYGTGAAKYTRLITRPKSGTVAVYRTRAGVTTDITGSCTINYSTGYVGLVPPAYIGTDTLSWSGQFFVPCRYDIDELPALLVDRQGKTAGELLVKCDSIPLVEVKE